MRKTLKTNGAKLALRKKLSKRETFQAHDLRQKTDRLVSILPDSPETWRRVKVWRNLDAVQSALPKLISATLYDCRVVTVSHWIQGRSLKSHLGHLKDHRKDWLSVYESVRLFRGFVHGLSQLHGRRIVHGDISTANIILQGPKPTRLVLIDCGSLWSPGTGDRFEGDGYSPLYAAPEYFAGNFSSPAALAQRLGNPSYLSDQFSASIVLYELLTGKIPFAGMGGKIGQATADSIPKYKEVSKQFVDANFYPRGAVQSLNTLVRRGLAVSPDDRFIEKGSWRAAVDEVWDEFQRPLRKMKGKPWAKNPILRTLLGWLASLHRE